MDPVFLIVPQHTWSHPYVSVSHPNPSCLAIALFEREMLTRIRLRLSIRQMTTLTDLQIVGELGWTNEIIMNQANGLIVKYFRPPYGTAPPLFLQFFDVNTEKRCTI